MNTTAFSNRTLKYHGHPTHLFSRHIRLAEVTDPNQTKGTAKNRKKRRIIAEAMDLMEMWKLIYQEELPPDIGPVKDILEEYSGIDSTEVEAHLHTIVSRNRLSTLPQLYLLPLDSSSAARRRWGSAERLAPEPWTNVAGDTRWLTWSALGTLLFIAREGMERDSIPLHRQMAISIHRPVERPAIPTSVIPANLVAVL